jgi:hypothetical protein
MAALSLPAAEELPPVLATSDTLIAAVSDATIVLNSAEVSLTLIAVVSVLD